MKDLTLFKDAVNNLDFSGLDPLELPPGGDPLPPQEPIIIVILPPETYAVDDPSIEWSWTMPLLLLLSGVIGIGSMWLATFIVRWLQTAS